MAKTELGTKRLCENCESKFYDLGRTPIVCPKCGTTFIEAKPTPKTRKPVEKTPDVETDAEEVKTAPDTESEDNADGDTELVSLEDADEERSGGDDDSDDDGDSDNATLESDYVNAEDVALDDDGDDDGDDDAEANSFLEDYDDDDPNVSDLVGGAGVDEQD